MADDDLERQIDEVEAVSAIYGDQWHVLEESSRVYSLDITDGLDKPKWNLSLQVVLPIDYPSKSPPQYELSAPWLRGTERRELCNDLDNIYLDNLGESIIFLWAEHIRQYLSDLDNKKTSAKDSPERVQRSEIERAWSPEALDGGSAEEEDDFDPALVEGVANCAVMPDAGDVEDLVCPVIHHGEQLRDRKSVFQAHLAQVSHPKQVKMVMDSLCENRKIAAATHNIQAYRIMVEKGGNAIVYQGCVDDGEIHAGSRMLHLLQIVQAENVLVVVTRWYGGIHLGPDRFKHISNLTRQILGEHGYIKDKDDKKGPKSGKKGRKSQGTS